MTIDDELILELIKPDANGNIGKNAPILDIIGEKDVVYTLEESTLYTATYGSRQASQVDVVKMTPDIVLAKKENIRPTGERYVITRDSIIKQYGKNIAIELENDIHWDFQSSLKQLKKYKINFPDTRIIIPKVFERFAPLYKNEGIRVYLWEAKRKWQCLKCEAEIAQLGPVVPKCPECDNHNRDYFRLVGLEETKIREFIPTA